MTLQAITKKLIHIIKKDVEIRIEENIESETVLLEVGVDSIAMMTIWVYAEEQFGFTAGEEALMGDDKFITVRDIACYIQSQLKAE